jgi:hypothetical protein
MRTPTAYAATLVLGFAAFGLGQNLQVTARWPPIAAKARSRSGSPA